MLFACAGMLFAQGGSEEESASGKNLTKVATSGQDVIQTAVPLIAGEKMGTWEALGLDVSRTHYLGGPPQLEANPAGDWDIGWIGATAAINGILHYDMRVVGLSGYDYSNMAFARKGSKVASAGDKGVPGTFGTADDWKGAQIIVPVGTVVYCDLALTLHHLGLSEDDVEVVNMDPSSGYQAFLAGQGDIFFTSSQSAQLLRNDAFVCVHTMKGMDAGMAGNLIANNTYIKNNEETLVTYLEGALEVLLWLHDEKNIEQEAQWYTDVMLEDFGVKKPVEDSLTTARMIGFRDLAFYEDLCKKGSDGLTGMQREWEKFFSYHVMMGSVDASQKDQILSAVDTTYLEKAIARYKQKHGLE